MRIRFCRDTTATTAVEFAMTAPLFIGVLFAIVEFCLVLYAQLALQHGVEMAARCSAINVCPNTASAQTFAVSQSYGLNPPANVFSVSSSVCGSQVSATYVYNFLTSFTGGPSVTLNARSCYPVNPP